MHGSTTGDPFCGSARGQPRPRPARRSLATAPKSNALYEAYSRVQEDVQKTRNDPVPLWIRNAPTQLMKDLDYGKDYKYAHDYYKDMQIDDPERPPAVQVQEYLPESLKGQRYYEPGHQGKEAGRGGVRTRVPVARLLSLLKEEYTLDEIHEQFDHISIATLEGAIDEVATIINHTPMVRRYYKHKLLLDEGFPPRSYFPMLNHRFDVKHVKTDLKYIGLPDEKVYALAAQMKRLIVTYNEKHFKPLAPQSKDTGVIGVTPTTPYAIVDKKLTALLTKSSEKAL